MSTAEPFMPVHLPTSRDTEAAEIDLDHDVDILEPTGNEPVEVEVPEFPVNEVFRPPVPGDALSAAELHDDLAADDRGRATRMKIDFKKDIAAYSARRGRFDVIDVPSLRYLMIDGHGDPNTQAYGDAISTIFPVAYKLKFLSKRELDSDYVVMPLEALWWSADMSSFTTDRDKSQWDWTALNMVPEWITDELFDRAVAEAPEAPAIERIRLGTLDEGRCVQTLHLGPFDDEGPVLAEMHDAFIPSHGLRMTGKHHEIYLSDIRRTAPAKLRTILRQPVTDAAS